MASSVGSNLVRIESLIDRSADDDALVAQAKNDRRAFAALYERHVVAVYGYCYHRLGNREMAEDATSLVFTRAMAALPSLRGSSFRGWLFGIAHHVVVDVFRGNHDDVPIVDASAVLDPAPSPEGMALADEMHRALTTAITQLSTQQRQVVELRLVGLTSKEIGETLGCSPGAVDVVQHHAVQRLRQLLRAGSIVEEAPNGGG